METRLEIELKPISATIVGAMAVITAIAGEWFPYDH